MGKALVSIDGGGANRWDVFEKRWQRQMYPTLRSYESGK